MSSLMTSKWWIAVLLLVLIALDTTVSRSPLYKGATSAPMLLHAPMPSERPAIPSVSGSGLTNYFVSPDGNDGNDGSLLHRWMTLQHAASVATAGATVHVAPGNYAGPITSDNSGTKEARIRFVSDVQWGAVIRARRAGIVWTNFGDYVDIQGFDIAGNDGTVCSGIINYASYVRIVGNHVHDVGHDTAACKYGSGIVDHNNRAAHDDEVIGNVVHDVGDFNHPRQLHHGIYHANLRGRIVNNLVYRCEGWGIHLWHAANQVTIFNNTIFNNAYGGILVGDGDDPGGFAPGVVDDYTFVANNIVYRNGWGPGASGYGIEEYGATGTHNQYLNNLVYLNGPANWKLQNGNEPKATIESDPRFIDYRPDGTGDYRPAVNSPTLRAGTRVAVPSIVSEPDIGARLATLSMPQ